MKRTYSLKNINKTKRRKVIQYLGLKLQIKLVCNKIIFKLLTNKVLFLHASCVFVGKLFFSTNRSFILMTVLNKVNYVILIGVSL